MKIFAILPAYNATATLLNFFKTFPLEKFTAVILIDDASTDGTYLFAQKYQKISHRKNFFLYQNSHNLGYGGNLIRCLSIALDKGADVIVELHPDGEYGFDGIDPAISEIKNGADLVLGNRFFKGKPAGMYWSKYLISRILSQKGPAFFKGRAFKQGETLHDLHQGFRVYSRKLLKQIPFHTFSFDYLFSWQIILAAIRLNAKIKSVPVTAHYQGAKRGAGWLSSIKYTLQTIPGILGFSEFMRSRISIQSGTSVSLRRVPRIPAKRDEVGGSPQWRGDEVVPLSRENKLCLLCRQTYFMIPGIPGFPESSGSENRWQIFFCRYCQIAFTHPQPQNIAKYYGKDYWQPPGLLGKLKLTIFRLAQHRRLSWVRKYLLSTSSILDVGAGEGIFGQQLMSFWQAAGASKIHQVTSLDTSFAKLQNPQVFKRDFLTWNPRQKFNAITFWESFEHVSDPLKYLQKAKQLLKPDGLLFIEYPRSNCLEAKLFSKHWFNLDLPRHLFHYTNQGMAQLLKDQNFTILESSGIWAAEYSPWGFIYSLISLITRSPLDEKFRYGLTLQIFLLTPLFLLAAIIEHILFLLGQSPIALIVAKTKKKNFP